MNDAELTTSPESGSSPTLQAGTLSFPKALGMGMALLMMGCIGVTTPAMIAQVTGFGSSIAVLLCIPIFASLVIAIATFSKRFVVTGSLMSYLGDSFGETSRIVSGVPLIIGYMLNLPITVIYVLIFFQGLFVDLHETWASTPAGQIGLCTAISIAAGYVCYRGIAISARIAVTSAVICIPLVLILLALVISKGGIDLAPQFSFKGLTFSSVSAGIFLLFSTVIAFEGNSALARETSDPIRNIPRILYLLIITLCAVMFVGSVIELPIIMKHMDAVNAGTAPSSILADAIGSGWLKLPLDVTLAIAAFASILALYNDASRVVATAAKDGLLPEYLSKISPRTRTPARAVFLLTAISIAVPAFSQYAVRQSPIAALGALYPSIIYLWAIPYLAVCIGVIVLKYRENKLWSVATFAGAFGFLAIAALTVYSITHGTGFLEEAVSFGAIIVVVALSLFLILRRRYCISRLTSLSN